MKVFSVQGEDSSFYWDNNIEFIPYLGTRQSVFELCWFLMQIYFDFLIMSLNWRGQRHLVAWREKFELLACMWPMPSPRHTRNDVLGRPAKNCQLSLAQIFGQTGLGFWRSEKLVILRKARSLSILLQEIRRMPLRWIYPDVKNFKNFWMHFMFLSHVVMPITCWSSDREQRGGSGNGGRRGFGR